MEFVANPGFFLDFLKENFEIFIIGILVQEVLPKQIENFNFSKSINQLFETLFFEMLRNQVMGTLINLHIDDYFRSS